MAPRPREAWIWLVVENRQPRDARGNVTVVRTGQQRPRIFGDQRAVRLHLTFPDEFFNERAIDVEVGMPESVPTVEHDPVLVYDDETWVEAP
jgi:hypothetical protein